MTRYRFIGDPNDDFSGPDMLEWFGLIFSRDDWTEVPEGLTAKIAGHSHFESEDTASPEPRPAPPPKPRGRPRKGA
jgi:hypothetical protein